MSTVRLTACLLWLAACDGSSQGANGRSPTLATLDAAQREEICEGLLDGSFGGIDDELHELSCWLTVGFELAPAPPDQGEGAVDRCETMVDACLSEPFREMEPRCTLRSADLSDCHATVEEWEACVAATAEAVDELLAGISCEDVTATSDDATTEDGQGIGTLEETPPGCERFAAQCPDLVLAPGAASDETIRGDG